ncbi:hypothetical protein CEXT_461901 [Caerostris extrusa]|uniref:Uncharacterized protein n=1 Tax=Caerostris extrusa TaxID=172846 RepID=A0AAV4VP95_CAEEX|nr:hypothetical protein CEXT_461901 [Caerostris extrusa]
MPSPFQLLIRMRYDLRKKFVFYFRRIRKPIFLRCVASSGISRLLRKAFDSVLAFGQTFFFFFFLWLRPPQRNISLGSILNSNFETSHTLDAETVFLVLRFCPSFIRDIYQASYV